MSGRYNLTRWIGKLTSFQIRHNWPRPGHVMLSLQKSSGVTHSKLGIFRQLIQKKIPTLRIPGWTLQWKGLNLYSRGVFGSSNHFSGVRILRARKKRQHHLIPAGCLRFWWFFTDWDPMGWKSLWNTTICWRICLVHFFHWHLGQSQIEGFLALRLVKKKNTQMQPMGLEYLPLFTGWPLVGNEGINLYIGILGIHSLIPY